MLLLVILWRWQISYLVDVPWRFRGDLCLSKWNYIFLYTAPFNSLQKGVRVFGSKNNRFKSYFNFNLVKLTVWKIRKDNAAISSLCFPYLLYTRFDEINIETSLKLSILQILCSWILFCREWNTACRKTVYGNMVYSSI